MCLICGGLIKSSNDGEDEYILLLDKRYIHKKCLDLSLNKLNSLHLKYSELKEYLRLQYDGKEKLKIKLLKNMIFFYLV